MVGDPSMDPGSSKRNYVALMLNGDPGLGFLPGVDVVIPPIRGMKDPAERPKDPEAA